jgi:hypothetical protein
VEFDIFVKFSKECEGSFQLRSPGTTNWEHADPQGGSCGKNNSENDPNYSLEIRKQTAKQSFLSLPHDREQLPAESLAKRCLGARSRLFRSALSSER